MRNLIITLLVGFTFLIHSNALAANKHNARLPKESSPELQILRFVTKVHTAEIGSMNAKVFTTSSFAEPENSFYLVLSKIFDFDPEEETSALYNLRPFLGPTAQINKIKVDGRLLIITAIENEKKITFALLIDGFKIIYILDEARY